MGDYRDPDTRRLGGLYAEGMLRMVREPDGSIRRLHPGERWSVDDASVNFPVCVPWPWGGDKCSEAFGVRIGRFQLLAALDDATDFCPGWNYTIRARDSYRAEDVVSMLDGVCRHAYKPERLMVEGGAWQAARTIAWREAAGIDWEDARGRPHSKLIENYFNRLWTILSTRSDGQIGRYRGEMDRETDFWMKAQEGTLDPRRAFPALETALAAVAWSVDYLQAERVESKLYGKWVPAEMHAAGLAALPRPQLAPGLAYLAMRERHMRVVRRMGMVGATALSPLGYTRPYVFGGEQLMAWDGAHVWLHFDPFSAPCTATATLAQAWRDTPAGTLLARDVRCLNAAPEVMRDEAAGTYRIGWSDPVAAALAEKRLANAAVRRELRVTGLGGGRLVAESELSAPEGVMHQAGILPASGPQTEPDEQDIDFAALEKAAGMVA